MFLKTVQSLFGAEWALWLSNSVTFSKARHPQCSFHSYSLISSFIDIACCQKGNMYFISGEFCSADPHDSFELCTIPWTFLSPSTTLSMQYYSHSLISSFIYIACCREGNMYFISGEFCSRDLHCRSALQFWTMYNDVKLFESNSVNDPSLQSAQKVQICTADLHCNFEPWFCKFFCQGEVAEEDRRFTSGHAFDEEEGEEADLSYATWSTSTWSSSRFSSSWSRKEALKQERGGDD